MFLVSSLLFAAVLVVLGAAAARGLHHLDEIVEVDPAPPDSAV